jgi:DTW domain-containing protein YfiP
MRGSRLRRRSGKGDASTIEVLSVLLSTWLKDQAMS